MSKLRAPYANIRHYIYPLSSTERFGSRGGENPGRRESVLAQCSGVDPKHGQGLPWGKGNKWTYVVRSTLLSRHLSPSVGIVPDSHLAMSQPPGFLPSGTLEEADRSRFSLREGARTSRSQYGVRHGYWCQHQPAVSPRSCRPSHRSSDGCRYASNPFRDLLSLHVSVRVLDVCHVHLCLLQHLCPPGSEAVGLVWYKCTDLRLLDHEPLSEVGRVAMISYDGYRIHMSSRQQCNGDSDVYPAAGPPREQACRARLLLRPPLVNGITQWMNKPASRCSNRKHSPMHGRFGPAVTSFGSPSLKTGIHRTRFLLEGMHGGTHSTCTAPGAA